MIGGEAATTGYYKDIWELKIGTGQYWEKVGEMNVGRSLFGLSVIYENNIDQYVEDGLFSCSNLV